MLDISWNGVGSQLASVCKVSGGLIKTLNFVKVLCWLHDMSCAGQQTEEVENF